MIRSESIHLLNIQLVQRIATIEIGDQENTDYLIWTLNDNGDFSNKSAWSAIRNVAHRNYFNSKVWFSDIPFKISFLAWRLVLGKLPMDDVISRFGNQLVYKCSCCSVPQGENIHRVFVESQIAISIWKHFGAPLGIRHQLMHIRGVLNNWWIVEP